MVGEALRLARSPLDDLFNSGFTLLVRSGNTGQQRPPATTIRNRAPGQGAMREADECECIVEAELLTFRSRRCGIRVCLLPIRGSPTTTRSGHPVTRVPPNLTPGRAVAVVHTTLDSGPQ